MPIYDYACKEHHWTVTKPMSQADSEEICPGCGAVGHKLPSLFAIDKTAAGSWNQQSFNPGLGCWTESTKHAEQIAKSRGLEPIGNEPPENLHKIAEKQRAETKAKRWAEADRVKLFE